MLRTVKSASGVVARWSFDCGYGRGLCCVGSSGLVGQLYRNGADGASGAESAHTGKLPCCAAVLGDAAVGDFSQ